LQVPSMRRTSPTHIFHPGIYFNVICSEELGEMNVCPLEKVAME